VDSYHVIGQLRGTGSVLTALLLHKVNKPTDVAHRPKQFFLFVFFSHRKFKKINLNVIRSVLTFEIRKISALGEKSILRV